MPPIDDPSSLTPEERLSEIASILADGVLRLHARAALGGGDAPTKTEAGPSGSGTTPFYPPDPRTTPFPRKSRG
jgi:hypothetical protein